MRPMIPLAGVHQHGERVGHVLHIRDLPLQRVDMALRQALHFCALSRLVAPEVEQVADLGHRKTEVARAADEAQHVDIGSRIIAVAGVLPISSRDETCLLVVADHLGGYA